MSTSKYFLSSLLRIKRLFGAVSIGVAAAILLVVFVVSHSAVATQTGADSPAGAAAPQIIQVVKRVGTTFANACDGTSTLTVYQGDSFYYCFFIQSQASDPTYTSLKLEDSELGLIYQTDSSYAGFAPGTSVTVAVAGPFTSMVTVTTHITLTAGYQVNGSPNALFTYGSAKVNVTPYFASVILTKTVGTSESCADTDTLYVSNGTTVYYCYQLKNTGNVTVTNMSLVDDKLGVISIPNGNVPPGGVSMLQGVPATYASPITVSNRATWTVKTIAGFILDAEASASDTAIVYVNYPTLTPTPSRTSTPSMTPTPSRTPTLTPTPGPGVAIDKTVSKSSSTACASTDTVSVIKGEGVFYCYKLRNTGQFSLTNFTVTDDKIGAITPNVTVLNGGQTDSIVRGPFTYTTQTKNTVAWQATYYNNGTPVVINATDVATVNVSAGIPKLAFYQLVNVYDAANPTCVYSDTVTVQLGTPVWYCYRVENQSTGVLTFVKHSLVDNYFGALLSNNTGIVLGPGQVYTYPYPISVTLSSSLYKRARWTATDNEGNVLSDEKGAQVNVIGGSTLTPTPTLTPTSTSTPTPTPTQVPIDFPLHWHLPIVMQK